MGLRPAVPAGIKRSVLVEAGHRCAIPACKTVPVELAHIVPWAEVKEHTFENLIALCPTCHTRYDRGEIDRHSMLRYKGNLSVLSNRYGDLERRVLELFSQQPLSNRIVLPGVYDILLMYLMKDGLLVVAGDSGVAVDGTPTQKFYELTSKGRQFVDDWMSGGELE